jgi:hypothetical protein
VLLPGQRHDSVGVAPLLDGVAIGGLIRDPKASVCSQQNALIPACGDQYL